MVVGCVVHLFLKVQRWINKAKHHIKEEDKASLFLLFRDIVTYKGPKPDIIDSAGLKAKMESFKTKEPVLRNLQFLDYLNRYYFPDHIYPKWALECRKKADVLGINVSNFAENSFLRQKHHVMALEKSQSPVGHVRLLTGRLEEYNCQRVLLSTRGRTSITEYLKYLAPDCTMEASLFDKMEYLQGKGDHGLDVVKSPTGEVLVDLACWQCYHCQEAPFNSKWCSHRLFAAAKQYESEMLPSAMTAPPYSSPIHKMFWSELALGHDSRLGNVG